MDSTAIERLALINVEDLLASFGVPYGQTGKRILQAFFMSAGRRFARKMLAFDDEVERCGLREASGRALKNYTNSLHVTGLENLPSRDPVLIVSNHPGMSDTLALFAALPRDDLKTIAAERPFLLSLPATSRHLIFVPEDSGRIDVLRSVAKHLRAGGAVLTFPAGSIEPDPSCMPGALESLDSWSESTGFFARLVPHACVVPAIVSGVIAAPSLRHPLTRLRRTRLDRERLAASLQLLARTFFPSIWPVHARVHFGPPISGNDLAHMHDPRKITQEIVQHVRVVMDQIEPYSEPV